MLDDILNLEITVSMHTAKQLVGIIQKYLHKDVVCYTSLSSVAPIRYS